ncbi:hypothetical protein ACWOE0_03970 [Enterococcus caccae]
MFIFGIIRKDFIKKKGSYKLSTFLVVFLGIILLLIFISMFLFWRLNTRKKNQHEQTKSDLIKEFSPLIVAYVGIFITALPYLVPEEKVPVFFPEYEDKISEIDKLKKDNNELKSTIANQTQEQTKLSKKNKVLEEKNYAELTKVSLVVDGLAMEAGNNVVADVNDILYFNEDVLKNFVEQEISYNEEDKTIYIGKKSDQKITKQKISEQYSILYGGENYTSLKDVDEEYHVGGETIADGFIFKEYSWSERIALLNTNNKFTKVEFDVGRIDESTSSLENGKMKIEFNGEKKHQENIRADITSQHYEYDITNVKTLKLSLADSGSSFGFYNIVFTK